MASNHSSAILFTRGLSILPAGLRYTHLEKRHWPVETYGLEFTPNDNLRLPLLASRDLPADQLLAMGVPNFVWLAG